MRTMLLLALSACATARPVVAVPAHQEPVCPSKAPTWSGDATALRGANIEKVCLVGASEDDYLRLHEAVAPREGTPLDEAPVRADIEQLYGLGLVNDVVAVAEALPSKGVMLSYVVEPFDVIGELSLRGVTAIPADDVKNPGLRASPQVVKALGDQVRRLLVERGYANASVSASAQRVRPGTSNVVVTAVEGPKLVVHTIRFLGRKLVPERELRGVLSSKVGEVFTEETAARDVVALSGACLDHGLLTSSVTVAHAEGTSGEVELVFTLTEGEVFRVGSLTTTGVSLGDEKAALKSLETKPKAIFSRSAVRRDVDRLEHFARQRGLAVEITPLTTLNPAKKTIDLVLELAKRADGTLRF